MVMSNKSTSILSHILPQRYQLGFADSDDCVWVYDRRRGSIAFEHPKRVAAERNFYDPEIEKFLADEVEGPFWKILERFERMEPPSDSDREHISLFASFFATRVPGFRESIIKPFCDALLDCDLQKNLDALGDFFEQTSSGLFVPKIPKSQVLRQMMRLGREVTTDLMKLDTHLVYSPSDKPFVTTDNPFVFVRIVDDGERPTVTAKSFLKLLPLSARVAVGFGLPGNTIWASKANSSQARKHNLSIVGAAWDIVLANSREQLESLLPAFPTETPRGPGKYPTVAA